MNKLYLVLEDSAGREVSMTKTAPEIDCFDRDDLVETFCNFLQMAGYVFPDEDDYDNKEEKATTSTGDELKQYFDDYKKFINKGF